MIEKLSKLSNGAWFVLAMIVASCAAIVIWAPAHFWESLGNASWQHIAGVITLIGTAVIGLFVEWRRRSGGGAIALLVVVTLGTGMLGCDGPPGAARRAVEVATVVVMDADRLEAERYTTVAEEALASSTTLAEYRATMAPHDALELALRVAQSTVLATDAALDTWREGGAERWPAMAACMVVALDDVRTALAAVGLRAPPELESVLGMVSAFAAAGCPAPGGAS